MVEMEEEASKKGGRKCWPKKTEQDTALETPGLMLRREKGARGMEGAWGLERGQPGQGGEGQESRTMGTGKHETYRLEEREQKGRGSRVARANLQENTAKGVRNQEAGSRDSGERRKQHLGYLSMVSMRDGEPRTSTAKSRRWRDLSNT